MVKSEEIERPEDGWKKITDMLRATYICASPDLIIRAIKRVNNFMCGKILKVQPRFGPPSYENDVIVTFDYKGLMICEL